MLASLPGCDPGTGLQRIGEGALDNTGNGTGGSGTGGNGTGGGGGGGAPDGGVGGGGGGVGGGGGTGGGSDMAGAPADMATLPACTAGTMSVGAASSYTVGGTPKYYKSGFNEIFIVRDSGGLFAVSAICPHAGCTNQVNGGQFYCPCHGATFAFDGSKPTSPAKTALKHYAMCVDASGNVTVTPTTSVPSTTRY